MKSGIFAFALSAVVCATLWADEGFKIPLGGQAGRWEAEKAAAKGNWKTVSDGMASNGAYESNTSAQGENTLEFRFDSAKPLSLRLVPVWWRQSEEKPAARFPDSLPCFKYQFVWPVAFPARNALTDSMLWVKQKPGPDRLVSVGAKLYFSAPLAGSIGVVDAASKKLTGEIHPGGYIADLVADAKSGRLFAANAALNEVDVIDTATDKVVSRIAVEGTPFALEIAEGRLLVACLEGKALAVVNPSSLAVEKRIPLPFKPQMVSTVNGSVVVWPVAATFDPETGKSYPADRLVWPERLKLPWTEPQYYFPCYFSGDLLTIKGPGWPKGYNVRLSSNGKLQFSCASFLDDPGEPGKTRAIETAITIPELGAGQKASIPVVLNYKNFIFFFIAGGGDLYRINLANPSEQRKLEIGQPVSLAMFHAGSSSRYLEWGIGTMLDCASVGVNPGTTPPLKASLLLAADRKAKRAAVVNPDSMEIVLSIELAGDPVSVFVSRNYVYAACEKPNQVLRINLVDGKIEKTYALLSEPLIARVLRLVPRESAEAPTPPLDECPSRLIVHPRPLVFNAATLQSAPAADVPFLPPLRCRASATVAGVSEQFWCDGMHVIAAPNNKWIDTSPVTDRYGTAELSPGDLEGTITFAMDDGPKRDWTLNRLMTKDKWFLARGDEDFEILNAPVFTVPAGPHVLKVKSSSPWARLDALKVQEVLDGRMDLDLAAEAESAPANRAAPSYRGVFAWNEPVNFAAVLKGSQDRDTNLKLSWTLLDIDKRAVGSGQKEIVAKANAESRESLQTALEKSGIYTLRAQCSDGEGVSIVRYARFAKLPKLEHPSLFYRKGDYPAIRGRIAQYPALFERYRKWLRRNVDKPGFLPKRMGGGVAQNYVQMEARWRSVGCAFATVFLEKEKTDYFVQRLAPIMGTGHQEGFEHAWEFAGAAGVIYDMLSSDFPEIAKYRARLDEVRVNPAFIPEVLMSAGDPMPGRERFYIDNQLSIFANVVHYFQTHAGLRGGNWWQGTRANCDCILEAAFRNLTFYAGFLGYDTREFFSLPFYSRMYIHNQYAVPRFDKRRALDAGLGLRAPHHGSGGKISVTLAALLSANPIEQGRYDLGAWIAKMNGPLPGNEDDEVDRLMMDNNAYVYPLFLALGWYDPKGAKLDWEDLPPSMLFDVEGEACMKSDWSPEMTDVIFTCGARDVAYREEPNTLMIVKGGQLLLGTQAQQGDHGDAVISWGNVVIAGNHPPERWRYAADWPRMNERAVIDRFAPQVSNYLLRDFSLTGQIPMNGVYRLADGIVFHSHTEHRFFPAGRILAYETRPEFDYVAGDATGAWPIDQMEGAFRQVVFIRPDVVIIYDRGQLGAAERQSRWIASVVALVDVKGDRFKAFTGGASMHGLVLVPQGVKLENPPQPNIGSISFESPAQPDGRYEYLVVLQTAMGQGAPVQADSALDEKTAKVTVRCDGQTAAVLFNRTGLVGGKITVGKLADTPLAGEIRHSYRHWKDNYLFKKWMQDPRLKPYVVDEDLKEFASMKLPDLAAPKRKSYTAAPRGISKGALQCDGATSCSIGADKCPKLNLGASDFLIQARFRLNKETLLTTDANAYTLLMKGCWGMPLLQAGIRAGSYNGFFARGRSRDNTAYRDILPRQDLKKTFLDGRFHTIAYVRKGLAGVLYVDGTQAGEMAGFDVMINNASPFEIAKSCQQGYFEGEIDDVRVWRFDSGLPADFEKAVALYERTRDEAPAELKNAGAVKYSIWKFDDPDNSSTAQDSGNNGYNLQIAE